jgi:hypothetical protein
MMKYDGTFGMSLILVLAIVIMCLNSMAAAIGVVFFVVTAAGLVWLSQMANARIGDKAWHEVNPRLVKIGSVTKMVTGVSGKENWTKQDHELHEYLCNPKPAVKEED